jgi:hypothetical protein
VAGSEELVSAEGLSVEEVSALYLLQKAQFLTMCRNAHTLQLCHMSK